jgi:hypothetical protein
VYNSAANWPQQGLEARPEFGRKGAQPQSAQDGGEIDPDLVTLEAPAVHQLRTRRRASVPASMKLAARAKATPGEASVQTTPTLALERNFAVPLGYDNLATLADGLGKAGLPG